MDNIPSTSSNVEVTLTVPGKKSKCGRPYVMYFHIYRFQFLPFSTMGLWWLGWQVDLVTVIFLHYHNHRSQEEIRKWIQRKINRIKKEGQIAAHKVRISFTHGCVNCKSSDANYSSPIVNYKLFIASRQSQRSFLLCFKVHLLTLLAIGMRKNEMCNNPLVQVEHLTAFLDDVALFFQVYCIFLNAITKTKLACVCGYISESWVLSGCQGIYSLKSWILGKVDKDIYWLTAGSKSAQELTRTYTPLWSWVVACTVSRTCTLS